MRGRAGSHDPVGVKKRLVLVVGLARYRNFNFLKIIAVKEMSAREWFGGLQVPGVSTISAEPMSIKRRASQRK